MNNENIQNSKKYTRRDILRAAGLPFVFKQANLNSHRENNLCSGGIEKKSFTTDCSVASIQMRPVSFSEELNAENNAFRLTGDRMKGPIGVTVQSGYEDIVDEAVAMWKSAANIDFVKGQEITISVFSNPPVDRPNLLGIEEHYGKEGEPGIIERSIVKLYNLDSVSPEERIGIAAHGIGHCLGLAHSVTWDTVMSQPTYGTIISELTDTDREGLQAIYGLPLNEGWNWTEWRSLYSNPDFSNTRAIARQNEYGEWERWYQGVPPYANNLTQLIRGENYWMLK